MLELKNIYQSFSKDSEPVLKGIDLHLKPAEFCVLIGSNGSGKSTLMNIIAGEYSPSQGTVLIQGHTCREKYKRPRVASVIQDVNKGTIPEMTLLENMALSLSHAKGLKFSFYHHETNTVTKQLQTIGLGLEQYLHTPLKHLSGGQRQMIATLMAINTNPTLLLLDEHTSALDPNMQKILMAYTAAAIKEHHLTSLMITHKLDDAIQYGDRLIMLHQGQIVFDVEGDAKRALQVHELLDLFHAYEDTVLTETSS